jgi:hypothetical protein
MLRHRTEIAWVTQVSRRMFFGPSTICKHENIKLSASVPLAFSLVVGHRSSGGSVGASDEAAGLDDARTPPLQHANLAAADMGFVAATSSWPLLSPVMADKSGGAFDVGFLITLEE